LNPRKCIGVKVKVMPTKIVSRWYLEIELVDVERDTCDGNN
tara:strand:+ start:106 stop:228 length:123 start_codon:yes stop_codon:yes gene_type:complete